MIAILMLDREGSIGSTDALNPGPVLDILLERSGSSADMSAMLPATGLKLEPTGYTRSESAEKGEIQ